jgi:hypothetical protein
MGLYAPVVVIHKIGAMNSTHGSKVVLDFLCLRPLARGLLGVMILLSSVTKGKA